MSTQTTNLKLTKPALSDPANITNLNNNWDVLDAKAKELSDEISTATTKLANIASGAEVNQNAFTKVKVGSTTISADAKEDTLTLVAGSNVTITPDATNDTVTIAATGETYSNASESTAGLMSAADKKKLNGIDTNANKYTHPTYTAKSSGFYKVTIDSTGHISSTTAVQKSDITALGIPAQDTTYNTATQSANGLMSSTDKKKLDGMAYSYGTSDLTAGSSSLTTGSLYFVYE